MVPARYVNNVDFITVCKKGTHFLNSLCCVSMQSAQYTQPSVQHYGVRRRAKRASIKWIIAFIDVSRLKTRHIIGILKWRMVWDWQTTQTVEWCTVILLFKFPFFVCVLLVFDIYIWIYLPGLFFRGFHVFVEKYRLSSEKSFKICWPWEMMTLLVHVWQS